MKVLIKISGIILTVCLLSSVFTSCTTEEQIAPQSENIDLQAMFEDEDFVQLAQQYETLAKQVKDINAVEEVVTASKEKRLTEADSDKLVKSLGFKSYANFENFSYDLADLAKALDDKYALTTRDRSELVAAYQQYVDSYVGEGMVVAEDVPWPPSICFLIFEICTGGAVIVDTVIFFDCLLDGGTVLDCLKIYENIYTVCFKNLIDCLT